MELWCWRHIAPVTALQEFLLDEAKTGDGAQTKDQRGVCRTHVPLKKMLPKSKASYTTKWHSTDMWRTELRSEKLTGKQTRAAHLRLTLMSEVHAQFHNHWSRLFPGPRAGQNINNKLRRTEDDLCVNAVKQDGSQITVCPSGMFQTLSLLKIFNLEVYSLEASFVRFWPHVEPQTHR